MKNILRITAFLILAIFLTAAIDLLWEQKAPSNFPSPRIQTSMTYDTVRKEVVLFGGSYYGQLMDETWVWDGVNWAPKTSVIRPLPRIYHAMSFDKANGLTVLFGGTVALGASNDTWIWDGSDWTLMSPLHIPPVRELSSMAYDDELGKVVLFGGGVRYTFLYRNDTWLWDGTDWTESFSAIRPSPRIMHEIAYDKTHSEIVLFGGFDVSGYCLGDTWIWNGENWTQKIPPVSPGNRAKFAFYYDDRIEKVVLYGGFDYNQGRLLDDTWIWDGNTWSQIQTSSWPGGRFGHKMAYDEDRGESVLFGGYNLYQYLNDTWTLKSPNIAVMLTALSPANVWVGLKNSDDVGTKFDLLAEAIMNGVLIGSGELDGVAGGSSGFNNAVNRTINLALFSPVDVGSGDTLSIKLSVRIAANSGHRSGTARLWFNDAAATSHFGATIGSVTNDYFLLNAFALGATAGPGPKKTIDVFVDRAVGGNPFKPFGTWIKTF
jgi:hypothetical protein